MKLILASASPRRYEILKKHGIEPVVFPADVDETLTPEIEALGPEQSVIYLAHLKAQAIYERINDLSASLATCPPHDSSPAIQPPSCHEPSPSAFQMEGSSPDDEPPSWILAADTIVYFGGRMIGKPRDAADAFFILSSLRGAENEVLTGVALIDLRDGREIKFCDTTTIRFKNYPDDEIHRYIREEAPFDKSGAYSIQSSWMRNVEHIDGDPENAIGLPWHRIEPLLK